MTAQLNEADLWYENEKSPVTRQYRYVSDAAKDMQEAKLRGWTVDEVKVDGLIVPPMTKSSWWLEVWHPQLVITEDNSLELRVWPRLLGGRLAWLEVISALLSGGGAPNNPLSHEEVTYERNVPGGLHMQQAEEQP